MAPLDVARPSLRRRRMSAPPTRMAPFRLPRCRPLPGSLEALDLELSPASPAQALASLRFLVLTYLSDLERRLSLSESAEWTEAALDMLHSIRADVRSHLPDLPDLHFPDLDFNLNNFKSLVQRWTDFDFSSPLSYIPTLSARLSNLHAHLASRDFSFSKRSFDFYTPSFEFDFDFGRPPRLDAFLAELPSISFPDLHLPSPGANTHPSSPQEEEEEAASVSRALTLSENGARLIAYADLPAAWQNNPNVLHGYRFIPFRRWYAILGSVFQLHNESLNIHTHLIPLVLWGAAFAGVVWPAPSWIPAEAARYTPFASSPTTAAPGAPRYPSPADFAESLFTLFALGCLASSALWHTMAGCAHRRAMETCARVDYVGIAWLIATSIATVVHHGYACAEAAADATPLGHAVLHPWSLIEPGGALALGTSSAGASWIDGIDHAPRLALLSPILHPLIRVSTAASDALVAPVMNAMKAAPYHPVGAACLVLCLICGVSGHVLSFCDWFNRVENRMWRIAFFVGISFSALAPLVGIAVLQGWGSMVGFVAPVGVSLLYYVLGIAVYATQVPERFIPRGSRWLGMDIGKLADGVGANSHAIWHVFIVLAMRAHRDGIREMREAALRGGCAAVSGGGMYGPRL